MKKKKGHDFLLFFLPLPVVHFGIRQQRQQRQSKVGADRGVKRAGRPKFAWSVGPHLN